MRIIITGGSGFIGSFAVKKFLTENHKVLNIDNLTYAGNNKRLLSIQNNKNYKFVKVNILSKDIFKLLFRANNILYKKSLLIDMMILFSYFYKFLSVLLKILLILG